MRRSLARDAQTLKTGKRKRQSLPYKFQYVDFLQEDKFQLISFVTLNHKVCGNFVTAAQEVNTEEVSEEDMQTDRVFAERHTCQALRDITLILTPPCSNSVLHSLEARDLILREVKSLGKATEP